MFPLWAQMGPAGSARIFVEAGIECAFKPKAKCNEAPSGQYQVECKLNGNACQPSDAQLDKAFGPALRPWVDLTHKCNRIDAEDVSVRRAFCWWW